MSASQPSSSRRRIELEPTVFARVVQDLTHAINSGIPTYSPTSVPCYRSRTVATIEKEGYFARDFSLPEHSGTHIDAPAHFASGAWTVDAIPLNRLVAPLVVLDISEQAKHNADYQVDVQDVLDWERNYGVIPTGAVVFAHTGWGSRWSSPEDYRNIDANGVLHFPGYSVEAAGFLTESRVSVGLGIDTLSVDHGPSRDFLVHRYTLPRGLYHLENVANLSAVPARGAIVVVAPIKLQNGSGGPVRILALSA
jgi:kynurenine formamidase